MEFKNFIKYLLDNYINDENTKKDINKYLEENELFYIQNKNLYHKIMKIIGNEIINKYGKGN